MAEASDTKNILYENLMDAGCDAELAKQVIAFLNAGQLKEGLSLLSKHRKAVLDCCHAEQKKIDCLDYLIYRLNKEYKNDPKMKGQDYYGKSEIRNEMGQDLPEK